MFLWKQKQALKDTGNKLDRRSTQFQSKIVLQSEVWRKAKTCYALFMIFGNEDSFLFH